MVAANPATGNTPSRLPVPQDRRRSQSNFQTRRWGRRYKESLNPWPFARAGMALFGPDKSLPLSLETAMNHRPAIGV